MHFMMHSALYILQTTTYFSLPYLDILDTKLVGQEFCVVLNVSLESDLNTWILEHQCRCPPVIYAIYQL